MLNLKIRPRRLRRSSTLRAMVSETCVNLNHLVYPLFIVEGSGQIQPISALPGISRFSIDKVLMEIETAMNLGVDSFALFPAVAEQKKTSDAKESFNPKGLNQNAISEIKKRFPKALLFTDVALDPYNSDGHDGLVRDSKILNDETVEVLVKMSLAQAAAGSDFVACSDMMDGRIAAIRTGLDKAGFQDTGILAYTAKYASNFYGPFREALNSAPKAGDKKTYQMDYHNRKEALRELKLDLNEGADIVMVKPALSYLDIISDVKKNSNVPVAAYNVSGEYSMVKLAAEKGLINEVSAIGEILTSIKRAGADIIFTYHALAAAKILKEKGSL